VTDLSFPNIFTHGSVVSDTLVDMVVTLNPKTHVGVQYLL